MKLARVMAVAIGLGAPVGMLVACGSRTGLLVPTDEVAIVEPDGATVYVPVGVDAATTEDVADALPLIDTSIPDAIPPSICADASNTLIYVVTSSNALLRFDPQSGSFSTIGRLDCPDSRNPFSMAVNHAGVGYVLYYTPPAEPVEGEPPPAPTPPGNIFRVDLTNAHCEATAYVAGQQGFDGFGMTFSLDTKANTETLYVASDSLDNSPGTLGAIDPTSLTLSVVGTFSPAVTAAELTSSSDGRLFAFYPPDGLGTIGSAIAQVDKTTAQVVAQNNLPTVTQGSAWAFGFWGGDFYTFTAPDDEDTIVTRYDPATGALAQVATYPEPIVGAGVSTCAPAQ